MLAMLLAACGASAPVANEPTSEEIEEEVVAEATDPRPLDPQPIALAMGAEATAGDDGVVRVSWPRDDVRVEIDGSPFPPAAGLTSWAAFAGMPSGAMLMGDTVVFEDEVDAAMDAAFAHGLEVTALHNHFLFDRPPVYFMHVGGMGDAQQLAVGVKAVWDAIRAVRTEAPVPREDFGGDAAVAEGTLDAAAIGDALETEATTSGGVVKVSFAREGVMHGLRVGGSMGLTTWAAFVGSDGAATVDGDFIMTAGEVQPVLRALRQRGFHVVALHNHMVGGEPFFYFVHYWGAGPALDLARNLALVREAQAAAP